MRAGRLDQVFDVEQPVKARTGSGAITTTWTSFASAVWGGFSDQLLGAEKFAAEGFNTQAEYQVEIRPLAGLTTQMRINYNGRYLDILSINDLKRNDRWLLHVKEGRSKGD